MKDNRTSIGSNRNKRIILCCVAVIVALVFAIVGFVYDIFQYNTGVVREISAVRSGSNELDLKLTYFLPMGG